MKITRSILRVVVALPIAAALGVCSLFILIPAYVAVAVSSAWGRTKPLGYTDDADKDFAKAGAVFAHRLFPEPTP